ncbi:hypothetical protein GQ53DRAFT_871628 [Thozetella sp. PMI_491]|nr:hypothetical protein GQ53DRAFT_871628 [Thozetella sp. PMI_491]
MTRPQGSVNKQISRYEFTAVYSHPDAKVDIVLVHGLNGGPEKTWTAKNGRYWPTDLLPEALKTAHANVLVYGYNADVYSRRNDRSASDNFIHQHAQTLVTSLTHYRKSEDSMRNPIIWVAHSLGGILTKRALLYSNDLRADYHEDYRSIFVSTYGIIFLGTPHMGSDIATWGHMLQSMSDVVVPRKFFDTEPVLLKTLKKDNETLQAINNHFLDIYQRFRIHMAHENHKTDVKGSKVLVVDATSASPQLPGVTYYGIEAAHSTMCKFDGPNAPGWRTVSTAIREWVADAPQVIQIRWKVEEDDRALRANLESFERLRPYERASPTSVHPGAIVERNNEMPLSPQISSPEITAPPPLPLLPAAVTELSELLESQAKTEPIFVHPEQFRPNSFFIGRDEEMQTLHRMLKDRKRRSEGTSAVLIQSLPGGGKTHLARQYVFQHKDDYPGGIYWVRAKSEQEMEYWYWRIAKNEALRGLIEHENEAELRNPKKITAVVKKWLSSQQDWLLVLDGIQFDITGVEDFIPDATNTSLIYTSTERAVTGDYRFNNPQMIELELLPPQEAQELLLLEMDKRQPWTQDDKARALELVQLMGRLPLMIHVAAQHLKATREPLSRYLRSYKNRPKAGGLPAYKAVREQLQDRGATAALNLMSILAFFDQHVPVEMITLGMSALTNITPIKTPDASHRKTTLSNTLKVLIAFALVERTDTDDSSTTSSRSSAKNSMDKHATYLDLLRIHSVVQAFFIDTLVEERQVQFWLERAVAIWCRSYDEADGRIREDGRPGLPDDYRRFSIHGKKLAENLKRFEKRAPEVLVPARKDVEMRLNRILREIDHLSQTYQSHIIDGSGEVPPASVFERSSSASETDSAATPPSQNSITKWVPVLGDYDDGPEQIQSPISYGPSDQPNPYHFHIPYPHQQPLMPQSPDPDNEDAQTVVPGHSPRTEPALVDKGKGIAIPRHNTSLDIGAEADEFARPAAHRVIRKNEQRRYHDRAGAWRDRTVSDPRVSISREFARGSIESVNQPPSSTSKPQSDAEARLGRIKSTAPPLSEGSSLLKEIGRRTLSSGNLPRPPSILGRNAYADVLASQAVEEACSPEFATSLAKIVSAPSSWTAATLKLLKENLSPAAAAEKTAAAGDVTTSQHSHDDSEIPLSPGPIFQGSRTANSSPSNRSSPFPPPPLPTGTKTAEYLDHGLPPRVQRWDTAAFQPSLSRLDSSSLAYAQDTMSLSFPSPSNQPPYSLSIQPPSQPWLATPGGYSSQPMSRDASRQSSNHSSSNNPVSAISGGSAGSLGSDHLPASATHHSSLINGSPPGSSPTRVRQFLIPRRTRRPSYTETEPSPRMDPAFPDVDTSYSRWEELNATQYDRRRAGSGAGSVIGEGSGAAFQATSGGSLPNSARWRFIRGGPRGRGRGSGRSQSQSPSPSTRQSQSPLSRGLSPDIGPGPFTPPPPGHEGESASRPESGGSASGAGSAAMGRSGSAGITVGDGRIIGFGTPPPQHVGSTTPPRPVPPRRGSRAQSATSRSPPTNRGDVGLGIQH